MSLSISQLKQYLEVLTFISADFILTFWPFLPPINYKTQMATVSQICGPHNKKDTGTSSVEGQKYD